MTTWIVTPVYRDVKSFLELRRQLLGEISVEEKAGDVRFVVLDDTAGQDSEIAKLEAFRDVDVIVPQFNLGHQRAIVYALRKTLPEVDDNDTIVTLDADGEDMPADLPRLLAALDGLPEGEEAVALAFRTKRRESFRFKALYMAFRLLFRALTGRTVRSGNFAAMRGGLARRIMIHPTFDLAYSSAILALDIPVVPVPCERGERFEGRSKMTYGKLSMHGLRMLMPFTDRIALRALAVFVFFLVLGAVLACIAIGVRLFTDLGVPGWASFLSVGSLIVSLVALGNFVTLFVLFSQNRAVSLANIEQVPEA